MGESRRVPLVDSFTALRFADTSNLSTLIAPPYDVITSEARADLAASSPSNIVHLILPEDPIDPYDRAAQVLAQWRWDCTLRLDEEPTLTVMRQEFKTPDGDRRVRTGIFATIAAEPYERGRVLPHEHTHAGTREDRLNLLRATRTATESIFLFTRDSGGSLARFNMQVMESRPDTVFNFEETRIALWVVRHDSAAEVIEALGSEPLYMADGHHRYETAAAHAEELGIDGRIVGFIVAVNDPGLEVLATHRLITGGRDFDREAFLTELSPFAEESTADDSTCTILWPDGQRTYLGAWTDEPPGEGERSDDPARGLLISKVERHVIQPLLEAAGPNAGLTYTADAQEAANMVTSGESTVAVLVPPTPAEEVLAVADAGGIMPSKSTFFFPKVPAGLVLWPID